ncbi:uncharacterized protein LOC125573150 [Nematostella vectensis]|uniref:uncharacterized protein LOC125573150 n=1 Tax=Nematostella vectensis TaxID=45351 RepID=UPI00207718AB|nr:uncharacterized protein LOC125573150 [Nematostella vectensis]
MLIDRVTIRLSSILTNTSTPTTSLLVNLGSCSCEFSFALRTHLVCFEEEIFNLFYHTAQWSFEKIELFDCLQSYSSGEREKFLHKFIPREKQTEFVNISIHDENVQISIKKKREKFLRAHIKVEENRVPTQICPQRATHENPKDQNQRRVRECPHPANREFVDDVRSSDKTKGRLVNDGRTDRQSIMRDNSTNQVSRKLANGIPSDMHSDCHSRASGNKIFKRESQSAERTQTDMLSGPRGTEKIRNAPGKRNISQHTGTTYREKGKQHETIFKHQTNDDQ